MIDLEKEADVLYETIKYGSLYEDRNYLLIYLGCHPVGVLRKLAKRLRIPAEQKKQPLCLAIAHYNWETDDVI